MDISRDGMYAKTDFSCMNFPKPVVQSEEMSIITFLFLGMENDGFH